MEQEEWMNNKPDQHQNRRSNVQSALSQLTQKQHGSALGMAQSFSESGQGVIAVNVGGQSEGTQIGLTDSSGNEILAYTPELSFSVFIYSSPDIVKGESYTVLIGSDSGTVTAN